VNPLPWTPEIHIDDEEVIPGDTTPGETDEDDSTPTDTGPLTEYEWRSPCPGGELDIMCGAARTCTNPDLYRWELWARILPDGSWTYAYSECFGGEPPPVEEVQPQITEGDIIEAVRTIGLPSLDLEVQPTGQTLVNLPTNFWTRAETFTDSVSLLGHTVDVEATPSEYTWHTGDGTTMTTTSPGARYPDLEVTHRYTDATPQVTPSVDVTYTVRYRIDGADWRDLSATLTATGETTTLQVREAIGQLTG